MFMKCGRDGHHETESEWRLNGESWVEGGGEGIPPSDQIFLDFMQFWGKFNKIVSQHSTSEVWRLTHENPGSTTAPVIDVTNKLERNQEKMVYVKCLQHVKCHLWYPDVM